MARGADIDAFGEKLRLALARANLSRAQAAQAASVDKTVVGRWMSGGIRPADHSLAALSAALARHIPGFSRAEWELPLGAFSERLGLAPAAAPGVAPLAADVALPAARLSFCRSADGTRLAIADSIAPGAAGTPLLRVPTWLSHVEYDLESPIWRPLIARLNAGRRLIRFDARGNGLSDRAVPDISLDAFVADLTAVVDATGEPVLDLFTMSQGAAVAIAYAVANPGRVRRLVLHGGYARGRDRRDSPAEREVAAAFVALMRHGWGDENSAFMRAFGSVYMPGGTAEQIGWWTELMRRTTDAETAIRIRRACDAIDVDALLPRVRCPTLVLHARRDQVVPVEEGRRIAAAIPDAHFVSVESQNHVILADEPAWGAWTDAIEAFLAA